MSVDPGNFKFTHYGTQKKGALNRGKMKHGGSTVYIGTSDVSSFHAAIDAFMQARNDDYHFTEIDVRECAKAHSVGTHSFKPERVRDGKDELAYFELVIYK